MKIVNLNNSESSSESQKLTLTLDNNGEDAAGFETLDITHILKSDIRKDIIHMIVRYQRAKKRSGTRKTKGRSEVNASTKKIYKQKGTGGARHGAASAPQFVGGGIAFGPVVRDHSFKINKKVRNLGLRSALSQRYSENNLFVIDNLKECKFSKVKEFASFFNQSDLSKQSIDIRSDKVLIIDVAIGKELGMSTANLYNICTLPAVGLNVVDILRHNKVIITAEAMKEVHRRVS